MQQVNTNRSCKLRPKDIRISFLLQAYFAHTIEQEEADELANWLLAERNNQHIFSECLLLAPRVKRRAANIVSKAKAQNNIANSKGLYGNLAHLLLKQSHHSLSLAESFELSQWASHSAHNTQLAMAFRYSADWPALYRWVMQELSEDDQS